MAPLGSEPEQVRAALNSAKLRHYPGRKDGDMFWRYRLDHGGAGETAICSDLGTYTNLGENGFIPWTVFVRALWVFDADDRLVDVDVWKIIDCP
jgi:hypothetical protein